MKRTFPPISSVWNSHDFLKSNDIDRRDPWKGRSLQSLNYIDRRDPRKGSSLETKHNNQPKHGHAYANINKYIRINYNCIQWSDAIIRQLFTTYHRPVIVFLPSTHLSKLASWDHGMMVQGRVGKVQKEGKAEAEGRVWIKLLAADHQHGILEPLWSWRQGRVLDRSRDQKLEPKAEGKGSSACSLPDQARTSYRRLSKLRVLLWELVLLSNSNFRVKNMFYALNEVILSNPKTLCLYHAISSREIQHFDLKRFCLW